MKIRWQAGITVLLAVLCIGCVVPVPHPRVHAYGVDGQIVSAADGAPIAGASVSSVDRLVPIASTDTQGRFRVHARYGWHGAYFIGPICLSLLPGWDVTRPSRDIMVSASGYRSAEFVVETWPAEGTGRVRAQILGANLQAGQLRLVPLSSKTPDANNTVEPTRAPEGARGSP